MYIKNSQYLAFLVTYVDTVLVRFMVNIFVSLFVQQSRNLLLRFIENSVLSSFYFVNHMLAQMLQYNIERKYGILVVSHV